MDNTHYYEVNFSWDSVIQRTLYTPPTPSIIEAQTGAKVKKENKEN